MQLVGRIEGCFGHSPGGVFQAGQHSDQGDALQAVEARVGMADPFLRPQADSPHAGRQGGVDAGRGVLDHGAAGWRHAQLVSRPEEQIRFGLGSIDAVAVGDDVQQIGDSQAIDHRLRVLAGRAQRGLDAGRAQLLDESDRARQQVGRRDVVQRGHVVGVLALHPLGDLRFTGRAAVLVQHDLQRGSPRNPAQPLVDLPAEAHALLVGQALPGAVVIFGSVGDDAVQVEDDCS